MTEDEAKAKWCPFSRVVTHGAVINRDNPDDGQITNADAATRCMGRECMAWRWDFADLSEEGEPVETWPDLVKYHSAGAKLIRHGFCGLAGKFYTGYA